MSDSFEIQNFSSHFLKLEKCMKYVVCLKLDAYVDVVIDADSEKSAIENAISSSSFKISSDYDDEIVDCECSVNKFVEIKEFVDEN